MKYKMPGYVIHLAVGKVYSQNNDIQNLKDFERGIIAPDIEKDKAKSHYGPYSSNPNLNKFIQENNISTSYKEGYFLHLLTDYLFYNRFLRSWDNIIYEDYDKLNARMIQKYGIIVPQEVQQAVRFKDGELSILNEVEIYKFIDAVGKINVRQIVSQKESDYEKQIAKQLELEV